MAKQGLIFSGAVVVALILIILIWSNYSSELTIDNASYSRENMRITITNLLDKDLLPPINTCDGDDLSPALEIDEVPQKAQSLVLIVDDPDALNGQFIHWLLWNIPVGTEFIAEGQSPIGAVAGTNSFGRVGYTGPCPPKGTHRYIFKLMALDTVLDLPVSTTIKELEKAMNEHILSQTEIVARYGR